MGQVLLLEQQIHFQVTEKATIAFRTGRAYRRKNHCQTSGTWSAKRGIPPVVGLLGCLSLESTLFPGDAWGAAFLAGFKAELIAWNFHSGFSCV